VIDLGPEGGDGGGRLVIEGTPETVAACAESYTGRYLRRVLAPAGANPQSSTAPSSAKSPKRGRRAAAA
jgi:excinuclease ABC subunit A